MHKQQSLQMDAIYVLTTEEYVHCGMWETL
jgi:hypothetical protein